MKEKILVTGGSGQLGQCLQKLAADFEGRYLFTFTDSDTLNITDEDAINDFFADLRPQYCINASAYTAVDKAEEEREAAFTVNAEGVGHLAAACAKFKTMLIHISTDYVFSGDTEISYDEDGFTAPESVYGLSKREGEERALEENPHTVIIRTSWLYSEYGKNFVKTMLHLFGQKEEMGIVADQFGQPTNANDLAKAIMKIIVSKAKYFGVFHFSNAPETTWFDFAAQIAKISDAKVRLIPITTAEFPTPAKRPRRSTMALDKIENKYGIQPRHWETALEDCLDILLAE